MVKRDVVTTELAIKGIKSRLNKVLQEVTEKEQKNRVFAMASNKIKPFLQKQKIDYPYIIISINSISINERGVVNLKTMARRGQTSSIYIGEGQGHSTKIVESIPMTLELQCQIITDDYLSIIEIAKRILYYKTINGLNFRLINKDENGIPDITVTVDESDKQISLGGIETFLLKDESNPEAIMLEMGLKVETVDLKIKSVPIISEIIIESKQVGLNSSITLETVNLQEKTFEE